MKKAVRGTTFAELFKKYRLRSEIETLSEFGDLLAQERIIYETSIFTRWQNGERVPKDRKTLIGLLKIFVDRRGIQTLEEANFILEVSNQAPLTEIEKEKIQLFEDKNMFKIPQASLGGLFKDYRIKKNITQLELVLSLGWRDTARLSRIEQGIEERPPRALVDKICAILQLQEEEKNYLLLAGNYLPTLEEINNIQKKINPFIQSLSYPVVIYDFCWRIILINKHTINLLNLDENGVNYLITKNPSAIEIVFDPEFIQNKYLKDKDMDIWHKNLLRFLVHFKSLQKTIIKEKWYIDMIKKMMKNDLFRKIWNEAQNPSPEFVTTRYGKKAFVDPKDSNKSLFFNISVAPLLKDPRFELESFFPANMVTYKYFENSDS